MKHLTIYINSVVLTFCILNNVTAISLFSVNNEEQTNLSDYFNNIYLIFYKMTINQSESRKLNNIDPFFKEETFKDKKTVFYINGFLEPVNANGTLAVISSYLSTEKYNVLQVNWTKYSMEINYYGKAVPSTYLVGKAVALAIEKLLTAKLLEIDNIILVGHSLGAQISGTIGRNLKELVPLIVGLDPAGPGFGKESEHLSKGDGKYVLVVHTDSGVYGTTLNDADLDLYVNKGKRPQPNCNFLSIPLSFTPQDFCSHEKSIYVWADVIKYPGTFYAINCDSQQYLRLTKCDKSSPIEIKSDMQEGASGVYYLHTNDVSPYGRGLDGI